jgi:hypothetical protein
MGPQLETLKVLTLHGLKSALEDERAFKDWIQPVKQPDGPTGTPIAGF